MRFLYISAVALVISVAAIGNPFGGDDKCEEGKPTCPPGYKFQEREGKRGWCLKYFPGNTTFEEAEKICRCQGGASLSGIENMKELTWVIVQAKASFAEEGIQTGGIWVGAYRRKACWDKKNLNKTECSKELQYQWTDRNTVGNLMWKKRWTAGAPHDNTVGDHHEYCVQLQVTVDPALANKNLTGFFDNRVCVNPAAENQFPSEGFLCGRPPKYTGGGNGGYGGGGGLVIIGAGKPTKKP
ncbi:C-type lectin domain-containing protein [Caenorhabditis elegans]|uniref:C-type lectin domain-containing protein n=1 Tax=Caenorhabditis elegans TaxID=6239 RepID=Q9XUG2_CAEEL|nr:C-type lectin domain-containing protein [Caenorhabditis elegans]CAB05156.2 C-type lectin domain-containing protein [Caenorhabditis elegans]|eukprot:NP_503089.2 Uncharacterized protein CELE_C49C3.11 [Caenorhabditis elegans]